MSYEKAKLSYEGIMVNEWGAPGWLIVQSENRLAIRVPQKGKWAPLVGSIVVAAIAFAVLLAIKPSLWITVGAPLGMIFMGGVWSSINHQAGLAGPWLVIDKAAGKIILPVMKREFPLVECRLDLVRNAWEDTGDSYSSRSTLYLVTEHAAYIIVRSEVDDLVRRAKSEIEAFMGSPQVGG